MRIPPIRRARAVPHDGGVVPVASLSIHHPIHLGIDSLGSPLSVTLAYRNLLIGGDPHSGKSCGMSNVLGHAALCADVDLVLLDGKEVELSLWESLAVRFVGADVPDAIDCLKEWQDEMTLRYRLLRSAGIRKVPAGGPFRLVMVVVDELAMFLVTFGTKEQQREFMVLLRDLVARGRAAGIIVVAATQRPSADIVPTSLRDLFAYRWALRCPNPDASDIILGQGWASQGHSTHEIDPLCPGVGLLLAEGGVPRRFRAAYLSDEDIAYLVRAGLAMRGGLTNPPPFPPAMADEEGDELGAAS